MKSWISKKIKQFKHWFWWSFMFPSDLSEAHRNYMLALEESCRRDIDRIDAIVAKHFNDLIDEMEKEKRGRHNHKT